MRILIACEFSGRVREAFSKKGHDVWSCDLLPSFMGGKHYQKDVLTILDKNWDMMIGHPPCTYLAVSGNRWMKDNKNRANKRANAILFFMELVNAPIDKICLENPITVMSTIYRKPDQYIQPYEFGHPETKKTSLWLKGLPKLKPTNIVTPEYITGKDGKRYSRIHYMTQWSAQRYFGMDREFVRSMTYQGIANAMAEQWG